MPNANRTEREVLIALAQAKDAAERYEKAFTLVLRPIFERKRRKLIAKHQKP